MAHFTTKKIIRKYHYKSTVPLKCENKYPQNMDNSPYNED